MKRIICMLLIIAILLPAAFIPAYADEAQLYTDAQIEQISKNYNHFFGVSGIPISNSDNLAYWSLIKGIQAHPALSWSLDKASSLIGQYPEKEDYAEYLANIIAMQSMGLAEQIERQSEFDHLKGAGDYALDVLNIASCFLGGSNSLELIAPGIDVGLDGIDRVIIKTNDQAKYYELVFRDYSQVESLLSAVATFAECEELRSVAQTMLDTNKTLLSKRLERLNDFAGNIENYELKFIGENLFFELLRETSAYESDDVVKSFVDSAIGVKNALLSGYVAGKFAFKMLILAGDIGFGTSDIYYRYQEMRVISDIADALVNANDAVEIPASKNQAYIDALRKKCSYYQALIVAHARGEYLIYQLIKNDGSIFSDIRAIQDYFNDPSETIDAQYNNQKDNLLYFNDELDKVFTDGIKQDPETVCAEVEMAITDAADFTWDWFYNNNHVDHSVSTIREDYGDYKFELVNEPGINSIQDLRMLSEYYYSSEVIDELIAMKQWIEKDGHLYELEPLGLGGPGIDKVEVILEESDENSYRIIITEWILGSSRASEGSCWLVDDHWVFDTLFVNNFGDPLPISVVLRGADNEDPGNGVSESELRAIASDYGRVTAFEYADYDGNGTGEAFALVVSDSEEILKILYLDSDGTVLTLDEGLHMNDYSSEGKRVLFCSGKGFYWCDIGNGGSGWSTLLYSVKDNQPYQLDLSRQIQGFYQEGDTFYTTENVFLPDGGHEYRNVELIYNVQTQQFLISTDTNIEANDAQETEELNDNTVETVTIENVFEVLPPEFVFAGPAGGWATVIKLNNDGSFEGQFHDSNWGEGEVYICDFTGRFGEPVKATEYSFIVKLESLNYNESEELAYEKEGFKYYYAEPYGLLNTEEFMIILPGMPREDIPEGYISWVDYTGNFGDKMPPDTFGLYNINEEQGFIGEYK